MANYLSVFGIDPAIAEAPAQPGDLVTLGLNACPLFRVIAVDGDSAWVRNIDNGAQAVAQLNRCHRQDGDGGPRADCAPAMQP